MRRWISAITGNAAAVSCAVRSQPPVTTRPPGPPGSQRWPALQDPRAAPPRRRTPHREAAGQDLGNLKITLAPLRRKRGGPDTARGPFLDGCIRHTISAQGQEPLHNDSPRSTAKRPIVREDECRPRSRERSEPLPIPDARYRGYRDVFIVQGGAQSPATGTSAHLVRAFVGLRIDCRGGAIDSSAIDTSALDCPALDCPALDCSALDCPALDCSALDC